MRQGSEWIEWDANEEAVVIKLAVPHTADFWADKDCMNEISANTHCDCDTITLVISDNRHSFVDPVTTTRDIPGVGVMFPD
jgi:hypothetical protein